MKQFIEMMKTHHPVKEVPKSHYQQSQWKREFQRHLNEPLVYTTLEKKQNPKVSEVYQVYDYHVVLRTKIYYANGKFRCYMFHSLNYNTLQCGDNKVVFIDG